MKDDVVLDRENSLVKVIQNDPKIDREQKMAYISMANLFQKDFKENLTRTSLELADAYGLEADSWRKFLSLNGIKHIIDGFVNEQIKKQTDKDLVKGKADASAIKVRQAIQELSSGEDNSKFVIIRLPDRVMDLHE